MTFESSPSSPSKSKTLNFFKNYQVYNYSPIFLESQDNFIQTQTLFIQKLNHPDEYFYRIQLFDNQFISHKNYGGWGHHYKLKNLVHSNLGLIGDSYSLYMLMILPYFSLDQK